LIYSPPEVAAIKLTTEASFISISILFIIYK
jgi:hypothetical protein